MSRLTTIQPEFVEFVPKELEEGILYVSVPYGTSVHKCACGCGSKITLPINPVKWRFLWDGERISLWPSVGNWSYACRSHYIIEQNRIEWAAGMSPARIAANRQRDKAARARYLDSQMAGGPAPAEEHKGHGLIDWLRGLIRR